MVMLYYESTFFLLSTQEKCIATKAESNAIKNLTGATGYQVCFVAFDILLLNGSVRFFYCFLFLIAVSWIGRNNLGNGFLSTADPDRETAKNKTASLERTVSGRRGTALPRCPQNCQNTVSTTKGEGTYHFHRVPHSNPD
jgi:hypothetical protein